MSQLSENITQAGPDEAPSVWVVSDGRAGMENQALGLAERLGEPFRVARLAPKGWQVHLPPDRWPAPLKALPRPESFAPPWPALMIGCGRRIIPYLLLARAQGVKTVYIQDPRVPADLFDLVIAPSHDRLSGPNVVPVLGSVHRITPARLDEAAKDWQGRFALPAPYAALLIGGPNSRLGLDARFAAQMADSVLAAAKRAHLSVLATASRRTGDDARAAITGRFAQAGHGMVWDGTGDNPLFGMLALSDVILVTSDSVNMASEAVATGKPVYRIDLPRKRGLHARVSKFDRFHADLEAAGHTRPFEDRIERFAAKPLDWSVTVLPRIEALLTDR